MFVVQALAGIVAHHFRLKAGLQTNAGKTQSLVGFPQIRECLTAV